MPHRLPLLALAALLLGGCNGLKGRIVEAAIADRRDAADLVLRESLIDGRPVAYLERDGTGPALVLIHGFGAQKDAWLAFADAYPSGRRLLIPDLAGHGGSVHDPAVPYDTERLVAELSAWMDTVTPGAVDVAGNSLGGAVAAGLALQRPHRVRRVVLMDPAGVRAPEPTALDSAFARGDVPLIPTTRPAYDQLIDLAFVDPPDIPGPARDVLAADVAAREPFLRALLTRLGEQNDALRPLLGDLRQPTLLLWGEQDRILSPSAVPLWEAGLPDVKVTLLPNTGHAPMQERPAETARLVFDFLSSADG